MNKKIKGLALCALFIAGCQAMPYKPYARKVKVQPKVGGVVALNVEHNQQDRTYAEQIMNTTCSGKSFDILEEGEVVIGTTTTSNETRNSGTSSKKVGSLWGMALTSGGTNPSTNTNSTTLQKKEWQIKYKCARVAKTKRTRTKKTKATM